MAEELAKEALRLAREVGWDFDAGIRAIASALRAYGDRRAEAMREGCARLVAPKSRLIDSYQVQGQLAELIRALPLAGEVAHAKQLPCPPPPDDQRRDEPSNRP